MRLREILTTFTLLIPATVLAADGNRLTYLDGGDPYYVGLGFPKLTTPQWVGEEGVEAVVVLAVDDMRDNIPKYEAFLRPILDRLKAIDGRAPVSIMTCRVDPKAPVLQDWIKEGVAIDVHTLAHPCPLLQKGDFAAAAQTYHGCVDLLNQIPGHRPVAFRMPCCDSLNTPSPRFYAEILNKTSPEGHFLSIDSSVFNITTPNDPDLPRELVLEPDGRERFRKYLPFPSFVNTIEDYPYPYVIGRLCWEFPCVVPSDWEAQHLHQPNNSKTVEDLEAALDAVVRKQGVFTLVFHPHGWIRSEQVVELIDHAVKSHGKKVKFLNFHEAQERLDKNLLGGQPLRAADGQDNGVRLLDVDNDGFLDVVVGNEQRRETRRWDPEAGRWAVSDFPAAVVTADAAGNRRDAGLRFGCLHPDRRAVLIVRGEAGAGVWSFQEGRWVEILPFRSDWSRLGSDDHPLLTIRDGHDRGVRLRDLDGDFRCELIVGNDAQNAAFTLPLSGGTSVAGAILALPDGARLVDAEGRDAGLRFVDLDEDGRDDIVFSNDEGYGIYLFDSVQAGWSRRVLSGKAGDTDALPKIVRAGTNNGFWVHSRHLWWQNEDTAALPDHVDRRSFNDLLKDVEPRAKTPEASLRSIRVRPGFQVELVASEPLVRDPIAFDWGADGRLWVVEMGDYPLGADGRGKPDGVVRFLEDTNDDGRYDKSSVFLDGLGFPAGIIAWREGVIVACAPEIFYAEDRDGDGRADVRETLFTGFETGNPQHRVNGFDSGLDGWIYGANGDSGGTIVSAKTGAKVNIRGRDFRFRPDDGRFEAESGQTQYGRHRDDWGNWFGNNNPNLAWHYVLADRDLRRNPRSVYPDPKQMLDGDNRLYPISRTLPRFNDLSNANRVTSANSPTPYRDELFGPAFQGNLFVSEPVHNLVRRVVLEPAGVTSRGHRAADEADREFLASSDGWFRPTMLRTGPDGALWIADMYRAVIEHPEWIPDDWEKRLDLRAGHDMGRIYRVFPADHRPRPIARLDRLDTAGLVAALDSPNGWRRDTAQRLLVQAGDKAAIEPLRKLVASSPRPKTRVQALWTLENLGALTPEVIRAALADAHPEVRRHAMRVGEELLAQSPTLGAAMTRLADDPDPRVRFQLALSLGAWDDPQAGRALARLLLRDPSDAWLRAAVLSSATPHAATILASLFAEGRAEAPPAAMIEPLFGLAGSLEGEAGLAALVRAVSSPAGSGGRYAPWQFSALAGLLDAADLRRAVDDLSALFHAARQDVADAQAPEDRRLAAVRLLGREPGHADDDRARLVDLLRPQVSAPLQQAALAALGRSRDPKVADAVLAGWKGYGPALRGAVLDALLSREEWTASLLSSLEDTCTPASEIDPVHRRRLLDHRDTTLRTRAAAVFNVEGGSRRAVLDRYRAALAQPGDPMAGAAVFKKTCASCHKLRGEGIEVGPDLATLTDKSSESLLIAILDPNRAFEAKYTNYTVSTTDGRVFAGLIAAETASSVTLRRQDAKEDVLLRAEIEEMAGSGQSLMPEGLETDLTPRDLADLIEYVRGLTTGDTGEHRGKTGVRKGRDKENETK